MKKLIIICLVLLFGEALMAQKPMRAYGMVSKPNVPGYFGRVLVVTREYRDSEGEWTIDAEGSPYAHVYCIIGKDTVRLTCDALGTYFWETNKLPDMIDIRVKAEGFEELMLPFEAKRERKNCIMLYVGCEGNRVLNEVIISSDKVEVSIQGDTTTYPVENAFKTFEGDWAGDLLRGLPGFSMENGCLTHNGQLIHRVKVNGFQFNELMDIIISDIERTVKKKKEVQQQQQSEEKK